MEQESPKKIFFKGITIYNPNAYQTESSRSCSKASSTKCNDDPPEGPVCVKTVVSEPLPKEVSSTLLFIPPKKKGRFRSLHEINNNDVDVPYQDKVKIVSIRHPINTDTTEDGDAIVAQNQITAITASPEVSISPVFSNTATALDDDYYLKNNETSAPDSTTTTAAFSASGTQMLSDASLDTSQIEFPVPRYFRMYINGMWTIKLEHSDVEKNEETKESKRLLHPVYKLGKLPIKLKSRQRLPVFLMENAFDSEMELQLIEIDELMREHPPEKKIKLDSGDNKTAIKSKKNQLQEMQNGDRNRQGLKKQTSLKVIFHEPQRKTCNKDGGDDSSETDEEMLPYGDDETNIFDNCPDPVCEPIKARSNPDNNGNYEFDWKYEEFKRQLKSLKSPINRQSLNAVIPSIIAKDKLEEDFHLLSRRSKQSQAFKNVPASFSSTATQETKSLLPMLPSEKALSIFGENFYQEKVEIFPQNQYPMPVSVNVALTGSLSRFFREFEHNMTPEKSYKSNTSSALGPDVEEDYMVIEEECVIYDFPEDETKCCTTGTDTLFGATNRNASTHRSSQVSSLGRVSFVDDHKVIPEILAENVIETIPRIKKLESEVSVENKSTTFSNLYKTSTEKITPSIPDGLKKTSLPDLQPSQQKSITCSKTSKTSSLHITSSCSVPLKNTSKDALEENFPDPQPLEINEKAVNEIVIFDYEQSPTVTLSTTIPLCTNFEIKEEGCEKVCDEDVLNNNILENKDDATVDAEPDALKPLEHKQLSNPKRNNASIFKAMMGIFNRKDASTVNQCGNSICNTERRSLFQKLFKKSVPNPTKDIQGANEPAEKTAITEEDLENNNFLPNDDAGSCKLGPKHVDSLMIMREKRLQLLTEAHQFCQDTVTAYGRGNSSTAFPNPVDVTSEIVAGVGAMGGSFSPTLAVICQPSSLLNADTSFMGLGYKSTVSESVILPAISRRKRRLNQSLLLDSKTFDDETKIEEIDSGLKPEPKLKGILKKR